MLVFLRQQAAELLVTLAEAGLTTCESLVALTQLFVQLSTNTNRGGEEERKRLRNQSSDFK